MEEDGRRGGAAHRGVAERNAVQIHLEDLRLRVAALDGEREQRLSQLALEGWLVAQQPDLDQLLRDSGGALHSVVRLEVDDRRARNPGGVDSRLGIKVAVLDREECLGQRGSHRGQRLVVMLVAGWVQVGDRCGAVARVEDRVRRNVAVELRDIRQRRRIGDIPRRREGRGHGEGKQQHNSKQAAALPVEFVLQVARRRATRPNLVWLIERIDVAHPDAIYRPLRSSRRPS